MGLRGIVLGVAVLAGAFAAPALPTAHAMPQNDLVGNATQIYIRDVDLTGVRLSATRTDGTGEINPEFPALTSPSVDSLDPPLLQPLPKSGLQTVSNCPSRDDVAASPAKQDWYATRTVWYEITRDSDGSQFSQRALVTVDTSGANFAAALEVFEGVAPPASFDRTAPAPALPTTIVACDRKLSAALPIVPAVVSFLTQPGKRYFLLAGVSPLVSPPSTPNLNLGMRYLDVTPPTVAINLDETPDASKVFEYQVSTPKDPTATRTKLSVTQSRGSSVVNLTRAVLGTKCDESHMRKRLGQYCLSGDTVRVRWRTLLRANESGVVTAEYVDRAGNIGTNNLKTALRDHLAPVLASNTAARWTRRGRLFVTASCTGGPGKITVQTGAARKFAGSMSFTRSRMRMKKVFPKVTRRTTFIHVICSDRSKNFDDTWLFLSR